MGISMDITGINNYTNYVDSADNAAATALKNKLNNTTQTEATDDELMDACKEFEAYLWEQVFKEMEKSTKVFSDDEDGDAYASNMVDYFSDSLIQEISSQAVDQGANSLSQMLYEQMKRNYSV